MDMEVNALFDRYEQAMRHALAGKPDLEETAAFYTSAYIAASPTGIVAGKNDDALKQVMEQGYAHYRAIGTKEMRIRDVRISPIDAHHCIAHVAWTATYARRDKPDVAIDFDVHYLVQQLDGAPKIFGWISGDEQALLKKHGIG